MDGAALEKFRKVCGLFTSEHDGERATAARMATGILKGAGFSWSQVEVGMAPWEGPGDAEMLRSQLEHTRTLLTDEQRRNNRLTAQIADLTRQLKAFEGQAEPPLMPERQPERRPRPEPSERTDHEGDPYLRDAMKAALELENLPEKTREFFESVLGWPAWTVKQRDAVDRSLKWVFKAAAG